jgi:hypothetical protein
MVASADSALELGGERMNAWRGMFKLSSEVVVCIYD